MSNEEMREQKMRLRLDLEDVEAHVAALREKANYQADKLMDMANHLKQRPERLFRNGFSIHHGQVSDLVTVTDSDLAAFDCKAMLALADDIRKDEGRIQDLRGRLARLG